MPSSLSRWLQPDSQPCRWCGKDVGPVSPPAVWRVSHPEARSILQQLCRSCMSAIPWIAAPVCRTCGRPEACPDCPRRPGRHFAFCRSAVRYDDRMKGLLALYKYRGSERLEPLMAAMLAGAWERTRAELPPIPQSSIFHMVTSVPLATARLEDRGFNQAERMAQTLAGWYGFPYRPLLQRVRHTEKQSLKNRLSRLTDMKGNFSASEIDLLPHLLPADGRPIRILLIDDVYTTGSTINECADALKSTYSAAPEFHSGNLEIYGILWARS
jgi:competence protein ComFC